MDVKSCLEQIRSYHDLRHFQTLYPDENIEEGLSRPHDEGLFLTASVAFLHKQLLRRIEDEVTQKNCDSITDLLIFDSQDGSEKIYLPLKHVEVYEKVIKSECSIPKKKLSLNQIIPKVKKPKQVSYKMSRSCSPSSSASKIQKTRSLFTIFSRSISSKSSKFSFVERLPSKNKFKIFKEYLKSIPSSQNILAVATNSTRSSHTLEMKESFIRPPESLTSTMSFVTSIPYYISFDRRNKIPCRHFSGSLCPLRCSKADCKLDFDENPYFTPSELEVLNCLTNLPFKSVRISQSENFRKTINRQAATNTSTEIIKLSDVRRMTCPQISFGESGSSSSSVRSKLKKQQSKLSVCLEDESESDETSVTISESESSTTYNSMDELKSSLSPELLEIVVNRIIEDLKNDECEFP